MAISSIPSAATGTTAAIGRTSGSRDNALIDIVDILTDESGRFSDDDKLAAQKKLGELSQARDSQNPYGFAGYSLEDQKHLGKINLQTSSFLRRQNAVIEKYMRFTDEVVRAGKPGSGSIQMQLDHLDTLSSFDKAALGFDGDYRETLVALKKVFLKLEERAAAGAYKMGASVNQTTDAEARTALLLLEAVQSQNPFTRIRAREEANALKTGGFGTIQDTVALSDTAKAYLDQR